jgi:protein-disulfide isomerase
MFDERVQVSDVSDDEWIRGRQDAPVTLLEYGDFECPACAATRPVLAALLEEEPETVRLVYRHFPVTSIHPHAGLAAEAAEAAGAQGEFWYMHDMLFANQDALEAFNLRDYAEAIGIDVSRFDRALRTHRYLPEVRTDFRRGARDGVNGTPTLFINGLRYDGSRDLPSLRRAIRAVTRAGSHLGANGSF